MTNRITDQVWNVDPMKGSDDRGDGEQTAAEEARSKGWRGQSDWLDLSSYRQCGYMVGCVFLLIAIAIMSACTTGLWIGEMWRK